MWQKLKNGLLKRLQYRETWVIGFILGIIFMNYPFVQIFNKPLRLFDIPLLFLYFQIGWAVAILAIYLFSKAIDAPNNQENEGDRH